MREGKDSYLCKIHSNIKTHYQRKNTNKIFLAEKCFEFLMLKDMDNYLSKSHSNINIVFQNMDTNKNFVVEKCLVLLMSMGKGMY